MKSYYPGIWYQEESDMTNLNVFRKKIILHETKFLKYFLSNKTSVYFYSSVQHGAQRYILLNIYLDLTLPELEILDILHPFAVATAVVQHSSSWLAQRL